MSEETAFSLDDEERAAWLIAFGEFDGDKFNWRDGTWERRDA